MATSCNSNQSLVSPNITFIHSNCCYTAWNKNEWFFHPFSTLSWSWSDMIFFFTKYLYNTLSLDSLNYCPSIPFLVIYRTKQTKSWNKLIVFNQSQILMEAKNVNNNRNRRVWIIVIRIWSQKSKNILSKYIPGTSQTSMKYFK